LPAFTVAAALGRTVAPAGADPRESLARPGSGGIERHFPTAVLVVAPELGTLHVSPRAVPPFRHRRWGPLFWSRGHRSGGRRGLWRNRAAVADETASPFRGPGGARSTPRRAVALLPGTPYELWLIPHQERLRAIYTEAAHALAEAYLAAERLHLL